MPAGPELSAGTELSAEAVAKALYRSKRDIQILARMAKNGPAIVGWPVVLRERGTNAPISDSDGWLYEVVSAPPARRGRPAKDRGESDWTFRRVAPPKPRPPRPTISKRFVLPGNTLGRGHKTINAVAAAAGIPPGAPVRAFGEPRPGEPTQVIEADGPGPVLGILLRPEGRPKGWLTKMADSVEVLMQGALLLPAAGPIGMGAVDPDAPVGRTPALIDLLLWDPEDLCWRGELVEGRNLLRLWGTWGLEHTSHDGEPAAVFIDATHDLRLDWVHRAESSTVIEP